MANTSRERLERWKRRTAQRALIGSADGVRYYSDERCARAAKLGAQLAKGRDKSVTEDRLAGVLAARRRRYAALGRDADSDGEHRHSGTDG